MVWLAKLAASSLKEFGVTTDPVPALQFELDVEAIRLLHRSVSFHLEKWPGGPDPREQQALVRLGHRRDQRRPHGAEHHLRDLLPLGEDLRQILGAQDIPQGRGCQQLCGVTGN